MNADAKTIQIFLPDGMPRGLRIAEITTRIVQAVQVPRNKLDRFLKRPESQHVGLYFLFGIPSDHSKPVAYIGQSEDLRSRLRMHHANREFWNSAVVVVSKTHSFTQAHIRYLEWLSIKHSKDANRYALENANVGSKPFVPEPLEADVMDAFETASTLLATLGYPIFEPAAGCLSEAEQRDIFLCRGPNAHGKGMMTDDGFVVLAGSLARTMPVQSAENLKPWLEQLHSDGILVRHNDEQARVAEDFLLSSPSSAATLILARKANGWIEWKRSDGTTLDSVYRANADIESGNE